MRKYVYKFLAFIALFMLIFLLASCTDPSYDSHEDVQKQETLDEDYETDNEQHDSGYDSYDDLKKHETLNEDYEIDYKQRDSDIAVIAIHGGGIEPGTSEVAKKLANQMGISYFLFKGIKSTNNQLLHIDSKYFDEPAGRSIAQNSVSTLSIHGVEGKDSIIYLGGRNEEYKEAIRFSLQKRGFQVKDAPNNIAGTSKKNIVNDNQLQAGVQLELTAKLRKSFFDNNDWSHENRQHTTDTYNRFINSLQEASNNYTEAI